MLAWPENVGAFAIIFQAAGVSWTLSSEAAGYDVVNYGLWYDDVQFSRVAVRHADIARRLKVKKIVIGEGGRTIKAIGQAARREIAEAAEQPVHLFLFVKVRENWADDPERYREMRLDFPKGK